MERRLAAVLEKMLLPIERTSGLERGSLSITHQEGGNSLNKVMNIIKVNFPITNILD
jgi:hypothetical protein